jgi:RimJ/RimL family protein N-acetyltransferase
MHIRGKTITLRAVEEEDLPTLHRWGNDPDLWAMLGGWRFPSSLRQTRQWFEGLTSDPLNQRFAIDLPGTGLVGTANLVEIDWKNNHAFHGMMIGEPAMRGRGIGVDVIMATMRYAFDELHMQRLDGSIIAYNEASVAVYCGKCGWQVEGRQRDWYFRDGRYWDRILVGVTRADHQALIEANGYWRAD